MHGTSSQSRHSNPKSHIIGSLSLAFLANGRVELSWQDFCLISLTNFFHMSGALGSSNIQKVLAENRNLRGERRAL